MNDCMKSDNFYKSLVHLANNSNLPISTAYFIIKLFCNEMQMLYEDTIREEKELLDTNQDLILNIDANSDDIEVCEAKDIKE